MKNIFFLIVVVILTFAFFTVQKSFNAFRGVSNNAEASSDENQNKRVNLSIDALENIKDVPRIAYVEIMEPTYIRGDNREISFDKSFEKQADKALVLSIQQLLAGNPQLAGKLTYIKVTALDGRVSLRGSVNNEDERSNIVHQVENTAGVDNVEDQLKVEGK